MPAKKFVRKKIGKCLLFALRLPQALCASSTKSCGNLPSFASHFDLKGSDLVQAEQVHGDRVAKVTKADKGRTIAGADALMTSDPNTPLVIRTADCVPIFIYDRAAPAIAAIHAGWRGSIKGIVPKTLRGMRKAFDTRIKDCIIAFGPAIGRCCYEVDGAVIDPLARRFEDWRKAARKKGGKWMLDLTRLVELQFLKAGVRRENIIKVGVCTCCGKMFHSFRKDGTEQRNYSLAVLR